MRIRGAVLREMGAKPPFVESRPISIESIELASPGPGEVLVRIHAAGLCHSDLSVITGDRPRPMPMLLGHEAAGEVVELGTGVSDLHVGDRVVLVFVPSCGHCRTCSEGRPALCEPGAIANGAGTLLGGSRRTSVGGQPLNHHLGCSAFAEYAVVSRRSIVPVTRDISYDDAALFGCAVLTGVGAVVNTASVRAGQTVAVIGLGGVGFAAILGALCSGAERIIAVDVLDSKLELATSLGATDTFNARHEDCGTRIREATHGGVDHALEFAGSTQALGLAYQITRRGGVTTTAGLPPATQAFQFSPVSLVAEERTMKGSYIGTSVPQRDIPRYISLYQQGRLPVQRLMTRKLSLDDINEGFDFLNEGRAIRQILAP